MRVLHLQYGLLTSFSTPVGVMIGVASLGHMCPKTVVYSAGAGVVPIAIVDEISFLCLSKDISSTIAMHANAIVVLACIRRYVVSRSVLHF